MKFSSFFKFYLYRFVNWHSRVNMCNAKFMGRDSDLNERLSIRSVKKMQDIRESR